MALPDVPTGAEGRSARVQVGIWHGIYAPKGTPKEVTEKLSASLQKSLEGPERRARFAELGTVPSARCGSDACRPEDQT
jgi:tripartite-type tricarboxylate transporter receptor subunit TctC